MNSDPEYMFKICVVGDSGVGKTSFIDRYIRQKEYDPDTKGTIGVDFATKTLTIKGKTVKAQMWDTSGCMKYRAITSAYYRGSSGILLFYDVTNPNTFHSIPQWLQEIRENAGPNTVIMIVGNKCEFHGRDRKISTAEGMGFAKSENIQYSEMSVRNSINLEDTFIKFLKKVMKKSDKIKSKNEPKMEKVEKSEKSEPLPDIKSKKNIKPKIESHSILLSASGLQNILKEDNEYFTFKFGHHELKISNFFAEFLSPTVSKIHLSDPTVDCLNFEYMLTSKFPNYDEFFTDDLFDLLQKISRGYSVDVKDEQALKLALIAHLIGNKELEDQILDYIDGSSVKFLFAFAQCLEYLNDPDLQISNSQLFDELADSFTSFEKNELFELPKSILYQIISNKNLKVLSEDDLFDFIIEAFDNYDKMNKESNDGDDDVGGDVNDGLLLIDFLEFVEVKNLSESKVYDYFQKINYNEITGNLWQNICRAFKVNKEESK